MTDFYLADETEIDVGDSDKCDHSYYKHTILQIKKKNKIGMEFKLKFTNTSILPFH